jgi:hypothetical protein
MADVNAVAYHEAGHAVVALALGSKVRVVEIGPQPHANCLHRGKKNKAIVALAGWLAEHWLEVEIVAAALLKRGKLTGAEIDALFCEG